MWIIPGELLDKRLMVDSGKYLFLMSSCFSPQPEAEKALSQHLMTSADDYREKIRDCISSIFLERLENCLLGHRQQTRLSNVIEEAIE